MFSVVSTFSERADSRQFAEVIAHRYANGLIVKEKESSVKTDAEVDDPVGRE